MKVRCCVTELARAVWLKKKEKITSRATSCHTTDPLRSIPEFCICKKTDSIRLLQTDYVYICAVIHSCLGLCANGQYFISYRSVIYGGTLGPSVTSARKNETRQGKDPSSRANAVVMQ